MQRAAAIASLDEELDLKSCFLELESWDWKVALAKVRGYLQKTLCYESISQGSCCCCEDLFPPKIVTTRDRYHLTDWMRFACYLPELLSVLLLVGEVVTGIVHLERD